VDLYVVRHAVAQKRNENIWPDDSERPLAAEGEQKFRRAARGLLRLVPEVGVVLSSPFARTWRTAEILEQAGWPTPVPCEELEPDYPPHKVLGAIARYEGLDSVAIVGHRPGLHELISYLLTGHTLGEDCGACVQIRKGGAARFFFDGLPEPSMGSLEWVLTPKALRRLGKRSGRR
jgi:phosphohistidine phosphatase